MADAPAIRNPLGPDSRFVMVLLSKPPDVVKETFGK
jgi:hypothetical protein